MTIIAETHERTRGDIKAEVTSLKRERIMEAATKLFAAQGFHGTSVDAIAAALGATKPFVYYHFKDKAEILAAICRRGAELTLNAIKAAETAPGNTADRLAYFCRSMAEIVIDHSHFLAVYNREIQALSEADRRSILRMRTEIDRRVVALIEVGRSSRRVRRGGFGGDRRVDHHDAVQSLDLVSRGSHRRPSACDRDRNAAIAAHGRGEDAKAGLGGRKPRTGRGQWPRSTAGWRW